MFLKRFLSRQVLPEESVEWIFEGFGWIASEFGVEVLKNNTMLVEPNARFFPGQADSPEAMAELIATHIKQHMGLAHWQIVLRDHNLGELPADSSQSTLPVIYYEPQQVNSPEVFIANLAHALAHHAGLQAATPPPCDEEMWFHMMELLAIYMGFGVMMANTAQPYRGGGCARCVSPLLERTGFLSEDEATYALAVFCQLKGVDAKSVLPHLKKSLRPVFKKSVRDLLSRKERVLALETVPVKREFPRFLSVPASSAG